MRLLVIDEDPAIHNLMDRYYRACDDIDSVRYANDDASALDALQDKEPIDIALVSIDSANHSGLSIFSQLSERSIRVPRVALTATHEANLVKHAIAKGATDVILKPLKRDDVLTTLNRVMSQVERRRRNWHERAQYMSLRREVDHAAEMQQQVLPNQHPIVSGLDVYGVMRPAKGIGGDFYDSFRIDDDRVGFVVADVAGKGVSAAFYMAMSNTVLRAIALRGLAPAEALAEVNDFLCQREIRAMYVSAFYAVLDTRRWIVAAANAGHPPIVLASADGEPQQYHGDGGPILGILAGQQYEQSEFELTPGSTMVMYTDGVTEAFNAARQQFGIERLLQSMQSTGSESAAAILGEIENNHRAFVGDAEQHDDLTLMAIQRRTATH